MTAAEVKKVFEILRDRSIRIPETAWNDRYMHYGRMLTSRDPLKVAEVLRDLHVTHKGQCMSYGEKRLCDAAMDFLTQSIVEVAFEPAERIHVAILNAVADCKMKLDDGGFGSEAA